MLYLVAAWLALIAVSLPVGTAVLRWAGADAILDRPGDRFVACVWLGTLALGAGLLGLSLVVALTPAVGAALGLAAAVAALAWRPVREEIASLTRSLDRRLLGAFVALAAGIAIFTAQPVVWFDTGLYHASAIRWLAEHGAVEGVALVHHPLGYATSWFALAAPFNADGLRDNAVAVMGGFALLLLGVHALTSLARALRREARVADWFLLAGAALLLVASAAIQKMHVSPSPDLPVNILGLLVGWAMLRVVDARRGHGGAAASPAESGRTTSRLSPGPEALPLLLALGAMTVKAQAAPLVVVAGLFYIWRPAFQPRRLGWAIVLGVGVLAPYAGYQLIATGCPAYPIGACVDVSWSFGGDAARRVAEQVQTFARWRTEPAPGSGLGWVSPWLTDDVTPLRAALAAVCALAVAGGVAATSRRALAHGARAGASWIALAGAAATFVLLLRTEEILMVGIAALSLIPLARRHPGGRWLAALGLSGIAVTLYAAPDPRFAFGYIAILFARLAVFQGPAIWDRLRPRLVLPDRLPAVGLSTLFLAAAIAAALGPLARPTTSRSEALDRLGLVVPPDSTPSVVAQPTNAIEYRVPDGPTGLCWAATLPCAGYGIDPAVVLRDPGEGIGGGFERRTG